jgi:F0F1-type ATP synthase delta subunit
MSQKLSRRVIARYIAGALASGDKSRRIAKILACYLIENHIERQADLFIRDIMNEFATNYGHLAIEITSARDLADATRREIITMVKAQAAAPPQTVEVVETIAPEIIGGVIVRTPDSEMDNSVRRGLERLRAI